MNNEPLKKASILIVEDESIVAMDMQSRLWKMGYEVAGIAYTGEEAVEKALKTKPDLILMDIRLKGIVDGISAGQEICAKADIPIVYLTARSLPGPPGGYRGHRL